LLFDFHGSWYKSRKLFPRPPRDLFHFDRKHLSLHFADYDVGNDQCPENCHGYLNQQGFVPKVKNLSPSFHRADTVNSIQHGDYDEKQ
jgi:hypothetical protein